MNFDSIFLQANQSYFSSKHVEHEHVIVDDEVDDITEDESDKPIIIPHEADTLVAFATSEGMGRNITL